MRSASAASASNASRRRARQRSRPPRMAVSSSIAYSRAESAGRREAIRHRLLVLDGTLIPHRPCGRRPAVPLGQPQDPQHEIQVIAAPDGAIVLVSGCLAGFVHDTAAARIWNVLAALRKAGLICLADKGSHGTGGAGEPVITPFRGRGDPTRRRPPTALTLDSATRANGPTPDSDLARTAQAMWQPHRAGRLAKAIDVARANWLQDETLTSRLDLRWPEVEPFPDHSRPAHGGSWRRSGVPCGATKPNSAYNRAALWLACTSTASMPWPSNQRRSAPSAKRAAPRRR